MKYSVEKFFITLSIPFRCERWVPWREIHHHLCSDLLSLLLQDEGRLCARQAYWQGKKSVVITCNWSLHGLYSCTYLVSVKKPTHQCMVNIISKLKNWSFKKKKVISVWLLITSHFMPPARRTVWSVWYKLKVVSEVECAVTCTGSPQDEQDEMLLQRWERSFSMDNELLLFPNDTGMKYVPSSSVVLVQRVQECPDLTQIMLKSSSVMVVKKCRFIEEVFVVVWESSQIFNTVLISSRIN